MSNPFTKKNPPQHVSAETHALAATGHSKRGIASYFGVAVETFERWMEEDDELREAFANGRENERLQLHAALFNKALKGDGPSAMFLLKSRHGYREGDQSEQSNKVQVTFNLPGAMTAEQYKTIEAVANPKPRKQISDAD